MHSYDSVPWKKVETKMDTPGVEPGVISSLRGECKSCNEYATWPMVEAGRLLYNRIVASPSLTNAGVYKEPLDSIDECLTS